MPYALFEASYCEFASGAGIDLDVCEWSNCRFLASLGTTKHCCHPESVRWAKGLKLHAHRTALQILSPASHPVVRGFALQNMGA